MAKRLFIAGMGLIMCIKWSAFFRADPQSVHLLYEADGEKLILVTCSGWDANGREYAERLVTRAVLVRQEPSPQTTN